MSKNIFNNRNGNVTSNISAPVVNANSIITNSLTTPTIQIPGSSNGDLLYINSQVVNGLLIAPDNNILTSFGGFPGWRNDINVNNVVCNDLKINSTIAGDLFTVATTGGSLSRLPIGSSGTVLTSNGSGASWQNITLPNPLTIANLVLTNNLKINNLPSGPLFSSGAGVGNISAERNKIQASGTVLISAIPTVISSINFMNVVAGNSYQVTVSFVANSALGTTAIVIADPNISNIAFNTIINTSHPYTYTYSYVAGVTGTFNATLTASNTLGSSTLGQFYWTFKCLGITV